LRLQFHPLGPGYDVTPHVIETLIKVISKGLGANTILNPKVEFKN
jgi:hypothetical protein